LHSSSSSFPPLSTPLAEKGGRGRQSGHEKKHQAGEQSKKRQRNKIKKKNPNLTDPDPKNGTKPKPELIKYLNYSKFCYLEN